MIERKGSIAGMCEADRTIIRLMTAEGKKGE